MLKKELKTNYAQFFTPKPIVDLMVGMIKNNGDILEPSCGDGAFFNRLVSEYSKPWRNIVGIEIDKTVCPMESLCMDFFDYPITKKFETIIGNPPYIGYKEINEDTKGKLVWFNSLFDKRTNLYLFFIYKCLKHLKDNGEIIFIIPREFTKLTSALKLNKYMFDNGTITDYIDLGDKKIFKDACPNCAIIRYEKNNLTHKTLINDDTYNYNVINGQIIFTKNEYNVKFSDLFFVKVGGVSGADKYFINNNGNREFVYSETNATNKLRTMYYNTYSDDLLPYKDILINRKIKKFNENTWFMWGRNCYDSELERIYVNCKTRNKKPFFYNECKNYDGSLLGIFLKFECKDINSLVEELNNVDWKELGFVCDGRYIFSQKSLENIYLPNSFKKWVDK